LECPNDYCGPVHRESTAGVRQDDLFGVGVAIGSASVPVTFSDGDGSRVFEFARRRLRIGVSGVVRGAGWMNVPVIRATGGFVAPWPLP